MNPEFASRLSAARHSRTVLIAEIADYELRRELLRAGLELSIRRLDRLVLSSPYQPISTSIMRQAAELWARSRRQGRPTADVHALDADVILAAGALELSAMGHDVVVATDSVRHLSLFVDARHWSEITLN